MQGCFSVASRGPLLRARSITSLTGSCRPSCSCDGTCRCHSYSERQASRSVACSCIPATTHDAHASHGDQKFQKGIHASSSSWRKLRPRMLHAYTHASGDGMADWVVTLDVRANLPSRPIVEEVPVVPTLPRPQLVEGRHNGSGKRRVCVVFSLRFSAGYQGRCWLGREKKKEFSTTRLTGPTSECPWLP